MRSQTTYSVSLFSSVYILTAGLSEVDCILTKSVYVILVLSGAQVFHVLILFMYSRFHLR